MGQLTQTTTQLQTILDDADASNAGNTSISDASDTTATSLKKSGFYALQASSSNAPSTDRAVVISAVRNTGATGEIRYGQVVITESNGLWWNSDDGGSLGTWNEAIGTTTTQTLTNKTLTSPVLTTPQINDSAADHQYVFAVANLAADRTVTLPLLTGTDTFVFEAHAQTLTNKILTAPVLSGSASAAGSILFKEDTDNGTNAVTLIGPAATADVIVTLPAATDTLVGKATTDTLTNKTLTSAVLNTGVSGTAVLDEDNLASDSATKLATQQSIKAYVDGQVSGVTASSTTTFSNKTISGSNNTLSNIAVSSTLLAAGTGISLSTNTLNVDAAQTGITSIYATDLILGEDAQTAIDFGTANEIDFKVDNAARLTLTASALYPVTNNQIDLGTASLEFKDAFFDGTVTSDAFAGPLTGNVTGNVSGTAATVTGAAQSNITSLGTLTTLTVDNVIINGSTIGHTGDTDLMTVASGVLTVAGEVSMTTLDIGGTNVTSTAAELNILDGVTSTAAELNILDGVTSTAAELNILDGVTSTAAELNILDGVTATTAELNYLDITTLGLTAASKAVTADANGVVTNDAGTSGEYTAVTSSSNAVSLNLQLGDNFSHDLTEATTVSFANPAASGKVSAATLRVIQGSTARVITWHSSIKWAGDEAPTLSTGDDDVDIFVFYTVDAGTTYYGFTAGQDMS